MKDKFCGHHLKTVYLYIDRKRKPIGQMCVICDDGLRYPTKFYLQIHELEKKRFGERKLPKHGTKKKKVCGECRSTNWTIRKMLKKPGETQHWKGTCKKCGNVWTQTSSKQYFIIDENFLKMPPMGL